MTSLSDNRQPTPANDSASSESPTGFLEDFMIFGSPEDAKKMRVEVAARDDGRVVIFHNSPFTEALAWLECDPVSGRIIFVRDDGEVRDFGLSLSRNMINNVLKAQGQVFLVLMDENTGQARSGRYLPLLVRRYPSAEEGSTSGSEDALGRVSASKESADRTGQASRLEDDLLPIVFDISPVFRADGYLDRDAFGDPQSPTIRRAVFERDLYRCRCCGFRAWEHQEVLAPNGNPRDFDHLLTTCPFCYWCFRLDLAGTEGAGTLVWLPELSQAALNQAAREYWIAKTIGGYRPQQGIIAEDVFKTLLIGGDSRRGQAQRNLGTDDPGVLAAMIRDCAEPDRPDLERRLAGIRLFPFARKKIVEGDREVNVFPRVLAAWRSPGGPFAGSPTWSWLELLRDRMSVV